MHQDTVVHLTCDNDHQTLESVLEWGKKEGGKLIERCARERECYGIEWEDARKVEDAPEVSCSSCFFSSQTDEEKGVQKTMSNGKRNPIMISSQQGFTACTTLLYQYGYRIPQIQKEMTQEERLALFARTRSATVNKLKKTALIKNDSKTKEERKKGTEGDYEEFRFKEVVANPDMKEDQVERLLLFKAYADPHYLSLALMGQERLNDPDEQKQEEIWALQQLDPLRRAFDLAEKV